MTPAMPAPTRSKMRIVIVDDEPIARRGIRQFLDMHDDVDVVGEARNGEEAVSLLTTLTPDLVFLDIQMPELDGFGVLRRLDPAHLPAIVFVTAFDTYAVQAFELHALDYLVKPVHEQRFHDALARARERLRSREAVVLARQLGERLAQLLASGSGPEGARASAVSAASAASAVPAALAVSAAPAASAASAASAAAAAAAAPVAASASPRRLVIDAGGAGGSDVILDIAEIEWVEAEDYYAAVHGRGRRHLIRESLASLEARLDPTHFVRVHRSAIVNLAQVREVRNQPAGDASASIILRDGTQLPLSRRRREQVAAALRRFAG